MCKARGNILRHIAPLTLPSPDLAFLGLYNYNGYSGTNQVAVTRLLLPFLEKASASTLACHIYPGSVTSTSFKKSLALGFHPGPIFSP